MGENCLEWRRLQEADLEKWVSLLHRAYAANLAAGMNFTAATLSQEYGRQVLDDHAVHGGFIGGELMTTFTLRSDDEGLHLNYYGVDPILQGKGYGKETLCRAEVVATSHGAAELLLDTPEIHPWLVDYYTRNGYIAYGHVTWAGKKYRSVLFRKRLVQVLGYPTADLDVNRLLEVLKSGIQAILKHHLVGIYLHGSLALGDFDPQRSDIDFLAVTDDELPAELFSALQIMHRQIFEHKGLKWNKNFEGSYMPTQALRRFNAVNCTHPVIRVDGSFGMDAHGSEWVIQRHVIREYGVTVSGPNPKTLIDPIQPNDLRQASLAVLHSWWAPQVREPFRLRDSAYQAYAILTMCRIWYTLEHGDVVSKPVAARFAQTTLGERWAGLIEHALAWRLGDPMDAFTDSVDFVRFTLNNVHHSVTSRRSTTVFPT